MLIRFHGKLTPEEAIDNLIGAIELLKERYHVHDMDDMYLNLNLHNEKGEDVELVDLSTKEKLQVIEVFKTQGPDN